ncbi:hypothetical protein AB0F81_04860 [Actinoplanes sp. NPDC024001]|uniref:hypothetical protein n=1 Tax=Actinoplanes sp. NPDC024001 TaxID=3154598 RepID=UPI0033F72F38
MAGRDGQVHRLLGLSAGSRNAWYARKGDRGAMEEYVDDVRLAWRLADRESDLEVARGRTPSGLVRQIRYGLAVASVNSVSRNIPPALLAAAVDHRLWPIRHALRLAAQQPFSPLRAEAFALLALRLPDGERRNALAAGLDAARSISHRPDWRLRAYGQLAAAAPDDLLGEIAAEATEVIASTGQVEADENLACLLGALPPRLWPPLADVPITTEAPVRPGADRIDGRPMPWTLGVRSLSTLVPAMPDPLVDRLVRAAEQAAEPVVGAILLAGCAARRPELLPRARAAVDALVPGPLQAEALAALTPHLPPEERAARLAGALRDLPAGSAERARTLTALAPLVPDAEPLLSEALDAAAGISRADDRSFALRLLVPLLPDSLTRTALAHAESLTGSRWGRVVTALAPRLTPADVDRALISARRIGDAITITTAFAALAAAGRAAPAIVEEALLGGIDGEDGAVPAWVIAELAPLLDHRNFEVALAHASAIPDPDHRRHAVLALAREASDRAKLATIDALSDAYTQVEARIALADRLGADRGQLLDDALRLSLRIEDPMTILTLVHEIASRGVPVDAHLPRLRTLARQTPSDNRVEALTTLLPVTETKDDLVTEILQAIAARVAEQQPLRHALRQRPQRWYEWVPGEFHPDRALVPLYPFIPDEQVSTVLGLIREIRKDEDRGHALLQFARHRRALLDNEFWVAARSITQRLPWIAAHTGALALMANDHERDLMVEVLLDAAADFPAEESGHGSRTTFLTALSPHLRGDALDTATHLADEILDQWDRESALCALAVRRGPAEALARIRAIGITPLRVSALADLADRPDVPLDQETIEQAIAEGGDDTDSIRRLARRLPADRRDEICEAFLDEEERAHRWSATDVYQHLRSRWRELATGTREDCATGLAELTPLLQRVATAGQLQDAAAEVLRARRWWP